MLFDKGNKEGKEKVVLRKVWHDRMGEVFSDPPSGRVSLPGYKKPEVM